jgi:hypothetical protein
MVQDIRASIKYLRDHEGLETASLNAVLFRAGIENQGHFYSTMMSLLKKKDSKEAQDMVLEIKEGLASLGIKPSYLQGVRQSLRKTSPSSSSMMEVQGTIADLPPEQDEMQALNVCIKSLQRFSQVKRENIINSVSMFYGLGAY